MRKKRQVVETLTEVVLATILLGVFAFTFAVVWSLNPVSSDKEKLVLGAQVSSKPFEILQSDLFEQTNFLGSKKSFTADYTFAVSHIYPEQEYDLLTLSNDTSEDRDFAIAVIVPDEQIQLFKIAGKVDDQEYIIYDYFESEEVYNLVVSLKPNTESVFKLYVKTYSEEAPIELNAKFVLEVLEN